MKKQEQNNQFLCRKCGIKEKRDSHNWCLSCYKVYKKNWDVRNKKHIHNYKKQYSKDIKGYYLYVIRDKVGNVLYVGETESLNKRLNQHISGNSHLKQHMLSEEWLDIKYLNITNLVDNREELRLLEKSLIELYSPSWNKYSAIIKSIDKLREFSLISTIHSLEQKWEIYIEREDLD